MMESSYISAARSHYAKSLYFAAHAEPVSTPLSSHAIHVIGLDNIAQPNAIHDSIQTSLPQIIPTNAEIRASTQITSGNDLPIFVESNYATSCWDASPFHTAATKIINNEQQRAAVIAEIAQATAEYQQALQQVERLQIRLSELGIADGQQSISGINTGFACASDSQLGFGQQPQVRFGGINIAPIAIVPSAAQSDSSIQPKINDYRFPAESTIQNQKNALVESVYIGIPNTSHFAVDDPGRYDYRNNNLLEAPIQAVHHSNTEENVQTAILPNNVVPIIDQSSSNLVQTNSDYHFDALRNLTSPQ